MVSPALCEALLEVATETVDLPLQAEPPLNAPPFCETYVVLARAAEAQINKETKTSAFSQTFTSCLQMLSHSLRRVYQVADAPLLLVHSEKGEQVYRLPFGTGTPFFPAHFEEIRTSARGAIALTPNALLKQQAANLLTPYVTN
jgi:hypothetical protein